MCTAEHSFLVPGNVSTCQAGEPSTDIPDGVDVSNGRTVVAHIPPDSDAPSGTLSLLSQTS